MFASYTQLYALQHQIRRKGKAFLWNLQIFCHKIMLFSTFLAFFQQIDTLYNQITTFYHQSCIPSSKMKKLTS